MSEFSWDQLVDKGIIKIFNSGGNTVGTAEKTVEVKKEEYEVLLEKILGDCPPPPQGSLPDIEEVKFLPDWLLEPDKPIDWIVDGRLIAGGVSVIAGAPKSGKTTLIRQMAMEVARGGNILGWDCKQSTVIYCALEEIGLEVKRHFRTMGAQNEPIYIYQGIGNLDHLERIEELAMENRSRFIIIDTFGRCFPGKKINDYEVMQECFMRLGELAFKTNANVLAVHHTNKSSSSDGAEAFLGSQAIRGGTTTNFVMRVEEKCRTLTSEQRYGKSLPKIYLGWDEANQKVTLLGNKNESLRPSIKKEIVSVMGEFANGASYNDICRLVKHDRAAVKECLDGMIDAGQLMLAPKESWSKYKLYFMPQV